MDTQPTPTVDREAEAHKPSRTAKGTRTKRPKKTNEVGYPASKLSDAYRGRQLLNADTIREMHAAFRVGGRAAIDKVMKNQPAIFLKPIRHLRGLAGGMRLRRAGIFCPFSGKRWPTWQCAGCDAPIGGSQALNLPDGNRVHFEPIDCLIRFGERWRGDASAALIALGLEPPRLDGGQL